MDEAGLRVRVFELRVHGVSGTPPESTLSVPHAVRIAGDARAGFFRAAGPDGRPLPPDEGRLVEAYSWGRLTSGGPLRALWLLLAPFTMVNVAVFTAAIPLGILPHERRPARREPAWRRTRRFAEAIVRLVALLLTLMFVLVPVSLGMDLIGWQFRAQHDAGRSGPPWLGFLDASWFRAPAHTYVVGTIAPLLLVALLWSLANHTWSVLEVTRVPATENPAVRTPLEDRSMWNGERPVALLRAVHATAALALIGCALILPLWFGADRSPLGWDRVWRAGSGWQVVSATGLIAGLLAAAVVLVLRPTLSDRSRPQHRSYTGAIPDADRESRHGDRFIRALPWVSVAVLCWTAYLTWTSGGQPVWRRGPEGALPGLSAMVNSLLVGQVVLLILLAGACSVLRWRAAGTHPYITSDQNGDGTIATVPVWAGLAPACLSLLACLLTAGWAAGAEILVARSLGAPVAAPVSGSTGLRLVVPVAWAWASVVGLVAIAAAVVASLVVGGLLLWRAGAARDVLSFYGRPPACLPAEQARRRLREVSEAWRRGRMDTHVRRALGSWMAIVALATVIGVACTLLTGDWVLVSARPAVYWGAATLALLVTLMMSLGRKAYRDSDVRRMVGISWDLATAWPRAAHPLAPPCYMERTVPELLRRLEEPPAGDADRIVLSCHSQGSVIGAAVLMQLDLHTTRRVSFLSYGSPLRRLYSVFFPGYFGQVPLGRLGQFLQDPPWQPAPAFDDGPQARLTWRWRNLWRSSDPIGGPIFADRQGHPEITSDVDWWLADPRSAWTRPPGEVCWPRAHGHSDYQADESYQRALRSITPSC